jgi:hypothetical protein
LPLLIAIANTHYLFCFLSINGKEVNFILVRKISKPGEVYWERNQTLYDFFGRPYTGKSTVYSTIVFTDYSSVQVRFICSELRHFWYTEAQISYYISIKDRSFDSISRVAPYINQLRDLGANLNSIMFLKNDLSCTN